jgi:hypothetical protein
MFGLYRFKIFEYNSTDRRIHYNLVFQKTLIQFMTNHWTSFDWTYDYNTTKGWRIMFNIKSENNYKRKNNV